MADHAPHLPSPDLTVLLRDSAERIERTRQLPADVAGAIRDEGLFRTWVPPEYGGPGRTALEGLESIAATAEADGAAGWCVLIALSTNLFAHQVPEVHAREIYGSPDAVTGGFAAPVGRAVALPDGGLRVTGSWQWGSGLSHCTHIGGGVLLVDADGTPTPRADGLTAPWVFFTPDQVTRHDNWHVMGLAGSGSADYEVTEAFVPEGRWATTVERRYVVEGAITRFPLWGVLALGIASVAVGVTRRALADLVDLAGAKRPQGSRRTLAERPATQVDVARAEATVRSAWAFMVDVVGDGWATAEAGDPLTVEQMRLCRLAATDAAQRCAEAVRRLHLAAGGVDVYLSSPIQRAFRDLHVATQHVMVTERTYELTGRIALGLETDTRGL